MILSWRGTEMFYRKLWLIVLSAAVLMFSFRGVASASAAGGFNQVLPGTVAQVYVSPAHGLAFAYNGGLWISTDRGLTWSQLDLRQFNDLAFLSGNTFLISGIPPNDALTYNSKMDIYSSDDDGDDWNPVIPYYEDPMPPAIMESAGSDLLGCFGSTIERSEDGGQTWTTVPASGMVPEKGCLAAIDEETYFTVQNDSSLLVTDDGGNSWDNTGIKLPQAPVPADYPQSETWLYGKVAAVKGFAIAFSSAGSALLYISRDDGKSWKKIDGSKLVIGKGSPPEVAYSAAVVPGGLAFVGTAHGVLVSEDYGETWKPAAGNIMGEVTEIACSRAGKKVVVLAAARGLYRMEYNKPAALTKKSSLIKFVLGQKSYSVNGKVYKVSAAPFVAGQRTFVPVRYLGDAMGVKTTWNQATKTVTLTRYKTVLKLVIGSKTIVANGKSSKMEVAPLIKGGRAYLPANYVAQAFGYTVSWDDKSKTMTITQGSS
jgi:photosystem II stability/assembly factor-like uncharacterized protein